MIIVNWSCRAGSVRENMSRSWQPSVQGPKAVPQSLFTPPPRPLPHSLVSFSPALGRGLISLPMPRHLVNLLLKWPPEKPRSSHETGQIDGPSLLPARWIYFGDLGILGDEPYAQVGKAGPIDVPVHRVISITTLCSWRYVCCVKIGSRGEISRVTNSIPFVSASSGCEGNTHCKS